MRQAESPYTAPLNIRIISLKAGFCVMTETMTAAEMQLQY